MWVKAVKTGDIAPGASQVLEVSGQAIALFNVGGKFYAIENTCPHQGGPLGEGYLDGKEVTCPWHAWTFDVTSGKCTSAPGPAQKTYPVKIESQDILIEVA